MQRTLLLEEEEELLLNIYINWEIHYYNNCGIINYYISKRIYEMFNERKKIYNNVLLQRQNLQKILFFI